MAAAAPAPEGRAGSGPGGEPVRLGGIRGGIPTAADINASMMPRSLRPLAAGRRSGPLRCAACGDALYFHDGRFLPHRGTEPMLPMHVAASRLRNHLRRLAITRIGLIDGDCYLLPFYRMEGSTPDGESTFTLLAMRLGDPWLERPHLPPANLRPWEAPDPGAAGPAGEGQATLRILPPTLTPEEAAARLGEPGWEARRAIEMIHYPFWLMRVGDCGKVEGAWMDGIEAKLILHRIRLTPPVPSGKARAGWTALPAVALLAGALAEPSMALVLAAAAWGVGAPLVHEALLRRWNG